MIAEPRRQRLTRAAKLIEESIGETLTFYAFPDGHWRKIRTNSPLERIMKEIRRRTKVMGGIDSGLHVVADDARAPPRGRHRAGVGIGQ